MNEQIYQEVFDNIEPFLPQKWNTLIYRCFYTQGSWSMKFYVKQDDEKFIDCFKISSNRKLLLQTFQKIERILSSARNETTDKNKWTTVTLIVNADGEFKADYSYIDLSENMVSYTEEWEKKYLI